MSAEQPPMLAIRMELISPDTGEMSATAAIRVPTRNRYMRDRAAMARSARSLFCGPPAGRRPSRSGIEGSIATGLLIGTQQGNLRFERGLRPGAPVGERAVQVSNLQPWDAGAPALPVELPARDVRGRPL